MPTLPNRHFATPKPSQLIPNPSKMAKQHSLLSLSLCMLALIQGSLAIGLSRPRFAAEEYYRRQRICQFDRLEALDPDNKVEAEAGITETWNPNHDQFQCAGVAVVRRTMEPNALHLPSYTNTPQIIYIVRGKGIVGTVFPGCAETYEEGQRAAVEVSVSGSQVDRHQKLQHVREGDVIAFPAGVAYWSYNSGDEPLIAITLHDTNNVQNQLDQFPSRFYLAGNPQDEFSRQQLHRYMTPLDPRLHGLRTTEKKNNMFRGFNSRFLEEAFNIDAATVRRLQGQDDYRNDIIRVKGKLDLVSPMTRPSRETEQEKQYQEERELERELERQQEQSWTESRGGYDYGYGNGLEETFCTMRLKENIGDPSRSDMFNPQAGRISTVNSFNLPILQYLRLSAERGHLYQNGIYTPHWNQNAHSVMYVIRGRGRVQVVDHYGQTFFDGEVRQGQILVIPQNHAVVKQAMNEGFEWVSFKTNDNAWISPLAGRTSVTRALPEAVLMNSFQITRDQAQRLKYNREETFLLSPAGSPRERRDDIAKM